MDIKILNKIKNRTVNIINPIYYKLYIPKISINNSEKREKKIIISLTSIPKRFDKINLCLESLFRQTYKPDKIILYLGSNNVNTKDILKTFEKLINRGLSIEFREDLGPHTKYFYAINEFPNDIIITVDDDIYYSRFLVEKLMQSYRRYPEAISCMRAHKITFNEKRDICKYNEWIGEYSESTEPTHEILATGVGGVLYPPQRIKGEALDKDKIKALCLKADDIWLKFMEVMNGTKVVIADKKRVHITLIKGSQEVALHKENVNENRNDIYINNLLNNYNLDLYKLIYDEY